MERYPVTEVKVKRCAVLQNVVDGLITLGATSELLGLIYRQILRFKKQFELRDWKGYSGNLLHTLPIPGYPRNWRKIIRLRTLSTLTSTSSISKRVPTFAGT